MAMVKRPVIFQIAGYQNSGKTTLIKKLIQELSQQAYRVAVIKHHGHGGKPDVLENKDSGQYISSGAIVSAVEGEGRMILQAEKKSWLLEEQIELLRPLNPDIILIEGHKNAQYPKAVILKNTDDRTLLTNLPNVQAAIYWDEEAAYNQKDFPAIPFFHITDQQGKNWIINYINTRYKQ